MKINKKRQDKLEELLKKIYEESSGLIQCAGDWDIDGYLEMAVVKDMKVRVKYLSKVITELNSRFYREEDKLLEQGS